MFFTKKGFTLVEMMVAVLLSAIVIFFSYTMTISAYKMFSKTSKTAKNFNNVQFFEEVFKKSITEATEVTFSNDVTSTNRRESRRITVRRYDVRLGREVTETYRFRTDNVRFIEHVGSHSDSMPSNITQLSAPTDLILETDDGLEILVLSNVRAFFYRINKLGNGVPEPHLNNIAIGIVYEDRVMSVPKRQNRSFFFAMRDQNGVIS